MDFGAHIDNAVRTHAITGLHVRTDISCTLFIADPDSYEGGELVIEDTYGHQMVKLPAGDMVFILPPVCIMCALSQAGHA